ncbi:alpha/beta-hydrolase [Bimuria novae-zelandiae CBS 107.79]|uniref:Alpha/beta-hydrolase n=1 Tax=Bimuria novae-zelandiae CBS 107.79 TaxID=1447943 RepID=A0A6A5UMK0_9PLEO|nr:alpha/beta-hydrolase [Bimuria novae-zelandiae CBS 107.79]
MLSKGTLTAYLPLLPLLARTSTARLLSTDTSANQTGPKPYNINVDPAFIEETRLKASKFRETIGIEAPAWFDGPPVSEINDIAKYWAEEYDWSKVQDEINKNFSHYYTEVPAPGGNYQSNESLGLHFIHERSDRPDAIPILFLHGWPSTSLEWEKVIHPLAHPNDTNTPAFHVVAPDLPGFGFSPAPAAPGLGASEHASLFASLMAQLGYSRYALYSTDLGTVIAQAFVVDHAPLILNHITDFYLVFPSANDTARYAANLTSPEETAYITSLLAFTNAHSAYSAIHSTLPLSLAYALTDSPVGFLAWRYQLAATVSDVPYTPQELITDTLLLYIPGVYGNIRSYKELYSTDGLAPREPFTVPTSVLQFGVSGSAVYEEISAFNYVPRDWVERSADVRYWKRYAVGGHFPALSVPGLVVGDVRAAMEAVA